MKLSEVDLKKAYRTWHMVAGYFRCFVRASNFVSLKHYPDFELRQPSFKAPKTIEGLERLLPVAGIEKTLVMVDLPDDMAVEAARMLAQQKNISPVITFKGLLHPQGLIGSKNYISLLLQVELERLDQEEGHTKPITYALILDSHRYGEEDPRTLQQCFNNQYELNEEDLPAAEILRQLGYEQMAYFGVGDLKEDAACYLEYLIENGIAVNKVNLEEHHEAIG